MMKMEAIANEERLLAKELRSGSLYDVILFAEAKLNSKRLMGTVNDWCRDNASTCIQPWSVRAGGLLRTQLEEVRQSNQDLNGGR